MKEKKLQRNKTTMQRKLSEYAQVQCAMNRVLVSRLGGYLSKFRLVAFRRYVGFTVILPLVYPNELWRERERA